SELFPRVLSSAVRVPIFSSPFLERQLCLDILNLPDEHEGMRRLASQTDVPHRLCPRQCFSFHDRRGVRSSQSRMHLRPWRSLIAQRGSESPFEELSTVRRNPAPA